MRRVRGGGTACLDVTRTGRMGMGEREGDR